MELPIDHFRLLGVSSSAGAEEILRVFQLRLDRCPDEGFTHEVLAQRSELLRLSADLLTDQALRQEYESAISLGASGLELSSNREVAGLILLWEADFSYEAFKLARKSLQPPQAPALGSGREADLALIAALSCRDAALEQQDQRRYAFSAELLQEGIQLLQRMGKLSEKQYILEEDLEVLLPFRILDLLSREIRDQKSHHEGLTLLETFVTKRGGLEGKNKSKKIGGLSQSDFELFFQQIRNFLTVQEQVELFINWYRQGSSDAGFLASIALVASGFAFRKPEHLQEARKYLKNLNYQGLDPMPLIGCLDLLLGDISQAEARFRSSNDAGLKDWLETYPGEELGAFCHYCRNWLQNDVLHGYRDIELITPDLDAWFADKNVQEYLEQLENTGARGLAKAGRYFFSSLSQEKIESEPAQDDSDKEGYLPMPGGIRESSENKEIYSEKGFSDTSNEFPSISELIEGIRLRTSDLRFLRIRHLATENPFKTSAIVFALIFLSGTSFGLLNLRLKSTKDLSINNSSNLRNLDDKIKNKDSNKLNTGKLENINAEKQIIKQEKEILVFNQEEDKTKIDKYLPLNEKNPSDLQLKSLIEMWLKSKANVLAGKGDEDFSSFARKSLAKRVLNQRLSDKSLGERQIINALIKSIEVNSRNEKRIAVKVVLNYKDQRINSLGEVLSETIIPSLNVQYILGKEKDLWQLVDYISGS